MNTVKNTVTVDDINYAIELRKLSLPLSIETEFEKIRVEELIRIHTLNLTDLQLHTVIMGLNRQDESLRRSLYFDLIGSR